MTGTRYAFETSKFGFAVKSYLYNTKFVILLLKEDFGQIFWSGTYIWSKPYIYRKKNVILAKGTIVWDLERSPNKMFINNLKNIKDIVTESW